MSALGRRGITRDQTIALWNQCEAARAAAFALGKSFDEAHEQARNVWNSWAQPFKERRLELERRHALLYRADQTPDIIAPRKIPENEESAAFHQDALADFSGHEFNEIVDFKGFIFPGDVVLGENHRLRSRRPGACTFAKYVSFNDCEVMGDFNFRRVHCLANIGFSRASFRGDANFAEAKFFKAIWFRNVVFHKDIWFGQTQFQSYCDFINTRFLGLVAFRGISSIGIFDLSGAVFERVPNFDQAQFERPPRLDNLKIFEKRIASEDCSNSLTIRSRLRAKWEDLAREILTWPRRAWLVAWRRITRTDRDLPARWRALKQLAIQSHDTDRELLFFSEEVRSSRFAGDWPLPWPIWNSAAWGGFFRFWFGILYQIFSDFGRSLLRPFLAWVLCIMIFAVYFLGQNPDMAAQRQELDRQGFIGQVIAYSIAAWDATFREPAPACFDRTEVDANQNGFSGLVEQARKKTNLVNEAFSIAYHNALVVLDSSGDSAHRAYDCLYGVERYGGNPVAFVPRSVAIASGIQKVLSAIFIFLFGLALRNMLKVK